ncbi:MAG: chlorite dismutase family protein, partial [Acidobacteriaceae bacterium]
MPELPPFPLTLDGSSLLHQMFRFDWPAWRRLDSATRDSLISEASSLLAPLEKGSSEGHPNQSAVFAQLGHKGDLLFVHYRDTIEQLAQVERDLARTDFASFLQPAHSYL